MINESPSLSLCRDLHSAEQLRYMSLTRQFDRAFRREGGRIIYAIDGAILNYLFRLPPRTTDGKDGEDPDEPESGRKVRTKTSKARYDPYQIFEGPADKPAERKQLREHQTRLALILLWHLLDQTSELGSAEPFLLLPGHDFEARVRYDKIVQGMARMPAHLTRINANAEELRKVTLSARSRGDPAEKARKKITKLLYSLLYEIREPHQKFEKFSDLLIGRRLMRLDAARMDKRFDLRELNTKFGHVFGIAGLSGISGDHKEGDPGTISWWNNRLHGALPEPYAENDRMALSVLDEMNRLLDPVKVRIVLITDNELFVEAGHIYEPFSEGRRADCYASLSFSDLYLRHPKSFLTDAEFLRPTAPVPAGNLGLQNRNIDDWLRTMLDDGDEGPVRGVDTGAGHSFEECARMLSQSHVPLNDNLETRLTLASRLLERKPELHTNLVNDWANYVGSLIEGHSALSPPADVAIRETFGEHELSSEQGIEAFLNGVRAAVRNLSEKSWTAFFRTAAETGLEFIDITSGGQQEPFWPVPSLYFQTEGRLDSTIRALWTDQTLRKEPSAVLKMIGALREEDDTRSAYVHTLCYGLMFAFAGRWPLTRLLAQRAIQIARFEEKNSGEVAPTSREANYLLAVATRVISRSEVDLAQASQALKVAQVAKRDTAEGAALSGSALTGTRFRAEALAIKIAELELAGSSIQSDPKTWSSLREQILKELDAAGRCDVEHIALKTRVALRSEYFATLLPAQKPQEGERPVTITHSERPKAHNVAINQEAELIRLYGNPHTVPARDRLLLLFASNLLGRQAKLPAWVSSRREDHRYMVTQRIQKWDKAALTRLNAAIESVAPAPTLVKEPTPV